MTSASTITSLPISHTAADVSPLPARERIPALDVLRGVAVAGILLANVLVFFGLFAMPSDRAATLPTAAADRVTSDAQAISLTRAFTDLLSAWQPDHPDLLDRCRLLLLDGLAVGSSVLPDEVPDEGTLALTCGHRCHGSSLPGSILSIDPM